MATLAARCAPQLHKVAFLVHRSTCLCYIRSAGYAKKIGGVGSGKVAMNVSQKVQLDVETDPEKLTKFCCGANIYTTGTDPELKPDSEYPEWLWSLRTDRKPPDLSELDPDTFYYWGRLRKMHRRRISHLMKSNKIK